ncbi:MAG: hypothetical protein N5P05_001745 [Chroococcopsis gigantea SAG 12.99]|jgi:hypothetical protein|nr:hypothetical protein [Chroococcopsis gigantea SAG 12.99]
MTLNYRGVDYEREFSPLEITEGEIMGKYRGLEVKYHYPRHMPRIQCKSHGQYRGAKYGVGYRIDEVFSPTSCPVVHDKPTKVVDETIDSVHMENIRRCLERRLQAAQERGDNSLVDLLKQEYKTLALNL